jgi:hypothetical protein
LFGDAVAIEFDANSFHNISWVGLVLFVSSMEHDIDSDSFVSSREHGIDFDSFEAIVHFDSDDIAALKNGSYRILILASFVENLFH